MVQLQEVLNLCCFDRTLHNYQSWDHLELFSTIYLGFFSMFLYLLMVKCMEKTKMGDKKRVW